MKRSTRWAWIVALVALTGAGLVLAFLLSLGDQLEGGYERHFVWLFWLNVAVALLLLLVLGIAAARLAVRLRRGKFGSRLLAKLAAIFVVVAMLPGVVIYTVSFQFVTRSIEAWFDVRMAGALDAGLALGRGTLQVLERDVGEKARVAASRLGGAVSVAALPLALERLREQIGAGEVSLLDGEGRPLASAGGGAATLVPERPAPALWQRAAAAGSATLIAGLDDDHGTGARARVHALARLPAEAVALRADADLYLFVVQPLPPALAANALVVQQAYSDYQQRALARESLRRMYVGTLTLALVLGVFGAVLLAFLLGQQLVRPLLLLADGVRQVAAGDLTAKPVFASGDELGGLTRSFADMTAQLAEAREQVQRGVAQLDRARTRLQTILDTLTAGVIVFDREGRIDVVNPGATRILRLPLASWRGHRLTEKPELQALAERIAERFVLLVTSPEAGERDHWQESFDLQRADGGTLTLLVRGALLTGDSRLVVFDDITEVVSAQRTAAWTEVARRLAHEIKNPLTPIQLSAERLQHKLGGRLEGAERALLERSVATIVAQVQAMQKLVNEFRDYARLPAAELKPLDLNTLVGEVLALYGHALDSGRLVSRAGAALPPILGDATQLRQVVHNLVQNALDAVGDRPGGRVEVTTAAARGESGELREVRLTVVDNGPGFAEKVLKRAFEPYVTTKTKGTGLGLAVVRKIADEHGARVGLANLPGAGGPDAPPSGARVSLSFSRIVDGLAVPAAAAPGRSAGPAPATGDATQVH
ncbi:MAG: ATP-binding protein [Rubrivivax sp.]|jgi:PAS domain S-box-containing protein|nr:ATP-binding protein [Rubrivivax sp.]